MSKRNVMRVGVGVAAAFALVLGASVPSQAAVATWWNGSATEWSIYSESSYNYNTYSRTGQYMVVPDARGGLAGLIYTKVWFGDAYTGSWQKSQSIGGSRKIGVAGQGKFQFYWGGTVTHNQYTVTAQATDAKLFGTSRVAAATDARLSAADVFALQTPANDYKVSPSSFKIVGTNGGTRLLTAKGDGFTVFTVLTSDSVAFSSELSDADFDVRAATFHVVNPSAKVDSQYVFVPRGHEADAKAVGGLTEVGQGVYLNTNSLKQAKTTQQSLKASGYVIPLGEPTQ